MNFHYKQDWSKILQSYWYFTVSLLELPVHFICCSMWSFPCMPSEVVLGYHACFDQISGWHMAMGLETGENRSLFNRIILGGLPGLASWHAVDETPLGPILFTGYHHSSRSPPYGEEDSRFSLGACFLSISWWSTTPFNYFSYTRQWLPCPSVGRSTHCLDLPSWLSTANLFKFRARK